MKEIMPEHEHRARRKIGSQYLRHIGSESIESATYVKIKGSRLRPTRFVDFGARAGNQGTDGVALRV
jgi:hypothetical protein